jgi:hypothetical protein
MGRMDLQHPDAEVVEEPQGVGAGVPGPAGVNRAHGEEAVLVAGDEPGDPLVDRLVEAHHLGSDVVDEGGAFDPLCVEEREELVRAREDSLEPVPVVPPPRHRLENGGVELPPGLNVHVAVENAEAHGEGGLARA